MDANIPVPGFGQTAMREGRTKAPRARFAYRRSAKSPIMTRRRTPAKVDNSAAIHAGIAALARRNTTALIAIATQCFAPDLGGVEILMTGLADQLSQSGHEVEVFADHIRARGVAELTRPYPIHRFGSLRPIRRFMKRRAIARVIESRGAARIFADS